MHALVAMEVTTSFVASPTNLEDEPIPVIPHLGMETHRPLAYDPRPPRWDRPATKQEQFLLEAPQRHYEQFQQIQVCVAELLRCAQRQLIKLRLQARQAVTQSQSFS